MKKKYKTVVQKVGVFKTKNIDIEWEIDGKIIKYNGNEFEIEHMINIRMVDYGPQIASPAIYFRYEDEDYYLYYSNDDSDETREVMLAMREINGNNQMYVLRDIKTNTKYTFCNQGVYVEERLIPWDSFTKLKEESNGIPEYFIQNNILKIVYYKGYKNYMPAGIKDIKDKIISFSNVNIRKCPARQNVNAELERVLGRFGNHFCFLNEYNDDYGNFSMLKEKSNEYLKTGEELLKKCKDEEEAKKLFKEKYNTGDFLANYYIDYVNREMKEKLEKEKKSDIMEDAKNELIEKEGNMFAVIKYIKEKYKCSNEEATNYVNTASESFNPSKSSSGESYSSSESYSSAPKGGCPRCGAAFSTEKISALKRGASVAMWGLASNTIGKQYKCTKCGYMW